MHLAKTLAQVSAWDVVITVPIVLEMWLLLFLSHLLLYEYYLNNKTEQNKLTWGLCWERGRYDLEAEKHDR